MTVHQLIVLRQLFYDYGSACEQAARAATEEDINQASAEVDEFIDEFEALLKELHDNVSS